MGERVEGMGRRGRRRERGGGERDVMTGRARKRVQNHALKRRPTSPRTKERGEKWGAAEGRERERRAQKRGSGFL